MEFLFELIFEIIFEGIFEAAKDKKIPLAGRIVAILILLLIYGGLAALFVWLIISTWKKGNYIGFTVMTLLTAVIFGALIWAGFRNKKK